MKYNIQKYVVISVYLPVYIVYTYNEEYKIPAEPVLSNANAGLSK